MQGQTALDDNNIGNNDNPEQNGCSRNCTRTIYVCHIMDKERFGIPFVMIPGFNNNKRDTEFLWLTCTILCHCKEVWHIDNYKVSPF